ncbi:hypothetical protein MKW94_010621, partial [Papaver nudicaule]|nr:hypothetical protein [Papaver nudicaule]
MDYSTPIFIILIISIQISHIYSQSIIQITDRKTLIRDTTTDEIFCDNWKFTIETNDAGIWSQVPKRCVEFVKDYMLGVHYASDADQVSGDSSSFMLGFFDIDKTLLSGSL